MKRSYKIPIIPFISLGLTMGISPYIIYLSDQKFNQNINHIQKNFNTSIQYTINTSEWSIPDHKVTQATLLKEKELLFRKAKAGNVSALYRYFWYSVKGKYGSKINWDELYRIIKIGCEKNTNGLPARYLAEFYTMKGNVQQGFNPYYDRKKGSYYLHVSAQRGLPISQAALSRLYERGEPEIGIPKDHIKALVWYAMYMKGLYNRFGRGTKTETFNIDNFLNTHGKDLTNGQRQQFCNYFEAYQNGYFN